MLKEPMTFRLFPIFVPLAVALVASHAVLSPEAYWKTVLPNTPMPKAVRELLHAGKPGGGGTRVNVGAKGEVSVSSGGKGKPVRVAFSVKPGSVEAEIIKNTIELCEQPGIQGEDKHCATSLESMIDFSTSKLGKNVDAISTEVENQTQMQEYTIEAGAERMAGEKSVVCHKQNCTHADETKTRAYMVPLEGADGTTAKAVAVCHTHTSAWNPKHLAFQVLNVKPGTFPICHFLPQDHIAWVAKQQAPEWTQTV